MDPERTNLQDGAVAIKGEVIAAVGTRAEIMQAWAPVRTIAPDRAIIIPGLIDSHTHMAQALVRGMVANELPNILRILVPVTSAMTPEEVGTDAALCATQLLSSGVTTVCEGAGGMGDAHLEATLEALRSAGIRCNFTIGRGDQSFGHAALYAQMREKSFAIMREGEAEADLLRTETYLNRFPPFGRGRITAGVSANSVVEFSPHYMNMAYELAVRHGAKLQIHASRDREEVEFCLATRGRRPIEQLAEIGVLDFNTVLAHAMLATEREIRLMGEARCNVAHSAVECVNILNAVPNVRMMRELGVNVALGGDNAANDMFRVMHAAWVIHTATRGIANYDPEYLTAEDILAMATIDAARLLGLPVTARQQRVELVVMLTPEGPVALQVSQREDIFAWRPSDIVPTAALGDVRPGLIRGLARHGGSEVFVLDPDAVAAPDVRALTKGHRALFGKLDGAEAAIRDGTAAMAAEESRAYLIFEAGLTWMVAMDEVVEIIAAPDPAELRGALSARSAGVLTHRSRLVSFVDLCGLVGAPHGPEPHGIIVEAAGAFFGFQVSRVTATAKAAIRRMPMRILSTSRGEDPALVRRHACFVSWTEAGAIRSAVLLDLPALALEAYRSAGTAGCPPEAAVMT